MQHLKWLKRPNNTRIAFAEDHDGAFLSLEVKPDALKGLTVVVTDITDHVIYSQGGFRWHSGAMAHAKQWFEKRLRQTEIEHRLERSKDLVDLM